MNRPWQDYADFGIRLLFWVLFIVAGFAVVAKFRISDIGQWFFWPVGAFTWWWLVISQLHPLKREKEKIGSRSGSVTVHLKLREGEYGSDTEREKIRNLTNSLDDFLNENAVGYYDGDEFGNSECLLFMYSTTPERLFHLIKPVLEASDFAKGAIIEIEGAEGNVPKTMVAL